MTHPKLPAILREYREGLAAALDGELDAVLLYGSQARGDASEADSDIDLLVILRGPFSLREATERTSELTARFCLEHDTLISRAFTTRDAYEKSGMPFYQNVRREGVPV